MIVVAIARWSQRGGYVFREEPASGKLGGGIKEEATGDGSHPLAREGDPEIRINQHSHPGADDGRDYSNPEGNRDAFGADEPAGWKSEDEAQDHKGGGEEIRDRSIYSVQLMVKETPTSLT